MEKQQLVTEYTDNGVVVIKQSFGKEFESHKGGTARVVTKHGDRKDFACLEAKHNYSPCWVEVEVSEVKELRNGSTRLTSKSITLDKANLEQFALNLLEIAKDLHTRGDMKITRSTK